DDQYIFYRIRRSSDWERKKLDFLQEKGLKAQDGLFDYLLTDANALDWLVENQEGLTAQGFKIIQEDINSSYYLGTSSLSFDVTEGNDWFDLHAVAKFGDYEIPFLALREHILEGHRTFNLPNGEIAIIPEEWFARYGQLFRFSQSKQGLRLKAHHIGLLDELSSFHEVTMERKLSKLQNFEGMEDVELPKGFNGTLRSYQQAGFNWFYFLKQYKFG